MVMFSSSVHCQKRGCLAKVFDTLDPYNNMSLVISGSQVMKTTMRLFVQESSLAVSCC